MNNFIISLIRTWTPTLVGAVLAWLAARGMEIDPNDAAAVVSGLTGLFIAGYYLLARIIERKFPSLGGLLLGSKAKPVYTDPK